MKSYIALFAALLIAGASCMAGENEQKQENDQHYVFSSRETSTSSFNLSVGPSITMLPQPLTEYPTPAPMLDLRWHVPTPLGLHAYGRVGSNFATSIAQAGGMYAHDIGAFSIGAGYSVAYVYGNIDFVDGFNTTQWRWINYPMVNVTAKLDKLTLTARAELELLTSLKQKIEDQSVNSDLNTFSGAMLTIAAEQPFWNDTHVLLGVTLSYSSNPYQAWFIYNTFNERLFSSELFVGFIL